MKLGQFWRTGRGTSIPTSLISIDPTAIPLDGEPVVLETSGTYQGDYTYAPTTTSTASTSLIAGILVWGRNPRNAIYAPGLMTNASFPNEPTTVNIGGRGSRYVGSSPAGVNQRFIAPMVKDDLFLIDRATTDAIVLGTAYGMKRNAAQDYQVDETNANACVIPVEFYQPDFDQGRVLSGGTLATLCRVIARWYNPAGLI
jgi:hypothetical protein